VAAKGDAATIDRRESKMKRFRWFGLALPLAAIVGVLVVALPSSAAGGAQHVRWDIISLTGGAPPGPINPGGHASAQAPDGDMITLTGSGTFVAPAGGSKRSNAVTGGGTWTTSTGSGTYEVKGLVSFAFANFQFPPPVIIDNIGDANNKAANGTAVFRIQYSDGSQGVLTVGCHGPGAPPGIFEGIATTKGFKTYYSVQPPVGGVDANRTSFHVRVH
jgi:hypothetical protein